MPRIGFPRMPRISRPTPSAGRSDPGAGRRTASVAAPAPRDAFVPAAESAGRPSAPTLHGLLARLVEPATGQWAGVGSGANAGWSKRAGPPSRDESARFQGVYAAVKAGKNVLPPEAKDHTYLMVGGLFTERYPGYMQANTDRLRQRGLDARRVPIDTDASVEANAKAIRDAVLAAAQGGRQVVLVGQSKGGVDVAAALALYPELKPHVRAVVAMQAPYGGTPIASDIGQSGNVRQFVERVVRDVFRGDPAALADLSYEARRRFVEAHPYPTDIPTVSLATSRRSWGSVLLAPTDYLWRRYGLKSDGLVPADDAEIPGSRVVRVDDMDHAESVIQGVPGFSRHRPAEVTEALVALALAR